MCACNKKTSYTESSPLVLGEPNGDSPSRFRASVRVNHLKPGAEFWATGSGVAAMENAGWIKSLP